MFGLVFLACHPQHRAAIPDEHPALAGCFG